MVFVLPTKNAFFATARLWLTKIGVLVFKFLIAAVLIGPFTPALAQISYSADGKQVTMPVNSELTEGAIDTVILNFSELPLKGNPPLALRVEYELNVSFANSEDSLIFDRSQFRKDVGTLAMDNPNLSDSEKLKQFSSFGRDWIDQTSLFLFSELQASDPSFRELIGVYALVNSIRVSIDTSGLFVQFLEQECTEGTSLDSQTTKVFSCRWPQTHLAIEFRIFLESWYKQPIHVENATLEPITLLELQESSLTFLRREQK